LTERSIEPDRSCSKASGAERRQLTVMFADLVGSTALSARLDPEELRDVIGAYHRRCAEVITSSGGFVAKYLGDGVLAYFGYPQAHEEDAEQAVRAGLALIDTLGRSDDAERRLKIRRRKENARGAGVGLRSSAPASKFSAAADRPCSELARGAFFRKWAAQLRR